MSSGDEVEPEEGPVMDGVTGFADSMAKLLGRRLTGVTNPVLAKRRTALMKAQQAQRKEAAGAVSAGKARKAERQKHMADPKKQSNVVLERDLKKVATKGVVALFNAIRKHQRSSDAAEDDVDETHTAKRRKETQAASQQSFLALLKQSAGGSSAAPAPAAVVAASSKGPGQRKWAALDDDYMQTAGIKDWDLEGSEVDSGGEELEAEYDDEIEGEF